MDRTPTPCLITNQFTKCVSKMLFKCARIIRIMQQVVYPTNFQRCILRCVAESFGKTCILLYTEDNYDSITLQMSFSDAVYNNGGSIFECQILEPKDGGRRYLVLTDIIQFGNHDWTQEPYMTRYQQLKKIITNSDYFNQNHPSNECRLQVPQLFVITNPSDVRDIFNLIIPNYHGNVTGVYFCNDQTRASLISSEEDKQDLVITKTRFSDVYHVTYDGINPVKGNDIAFVPTMQVSLKLRDIFQNRNSIKLPCSFHTIRQKWTPIF